MRLGKTGPISHQAVFTAVNASGYKVADHNITLRYLPSASLPSTTKYQLGCHYLGFKISRKFGNAVMRNKVRRRLRAIYYSYIHHADCQLAPGYIVIIPRYQSKEATFIELAYSFTKLLNKLIVRKSSNNLSTDLQI